MAAALTRVGAPLEVVRIVHGSRLDEARFDFPGYLTSTLAASRAFGGRFNPPGEFGAIYTALDEETAWAEVVSRFGREGIDGLPPDMGVLRIAVRAGSYADLTTAAAWRAWSITRDDLTADDSSNARRDACWRIGRAVRAVADALQVPSARTSGANMPLFPDREHSALEVDLRTARARGVPKRYAQRAREEWDG